ncbi:MAG: YceI family protein [Actinomycetota bacterium]|nr:YceI family protein [Actinomycetota bacterium]
MAWSIDTAHTSVGFVARHLGLSKVRGQFTSFRGEVEGDSTDVSTAQGWFEIDMASVETGSADRDAHLKSADFFDVEKYPTMKFVSKSIQRHGDGYKVTGDLTIKDTTKEVALEYEHGGEVTDPFGNRKIGGTLTGTIKRSEWGLTWNVPLESGGWLVSDNIKIEIDLQVAESKEAVQEEAQAEAEISA